MSCISSQEEEGLEAEAEEALQAELIALGQQVEVLTAKVEGKDREMVEMERELEEMKNKNVALENQLTEYMEAMHEQTKVWCRIQY